MAQSTVLEGNAQSGEFVDYYKDEHFKLPVLETRLKAPGLSVQGSSGAL